MSHHFVTAAQHSIIRGRSVIVLTHSNRSLIIDTGRKHITEGMAEGKHVVSQASVFMGQCSWNA